ncbi:MAG: alpha/beta fold hydrolase [Acidimicrobiales bacterium]
MGEHPRAATCTGEEIPFWFGDGDRKLFGWLHLPAGRQARGGVVLCQPLGIEAICVYYTYRLLAQELAARGLAVLRFDYDGTGDSCGGETDPGRLDAWLASVQTAGDWLTSAGVRAFGIVGVRIGGLFAAREAARRGGVGALVLWDACLSGRSFLREQRFLRVLGDSTADGDEDAVEAPGIRFEPETVKELSDLAIADLVGPLAARTLVLTPPGLSRPRRLEHRLEDSSVDWEQATGQSDLLDSRLQMPPLDVVERVADWLSNALDGEPVDVRTPTGDAGVVDVREAASSALVTERTVSLGPYHLFGIVTEPETRPIGPTIVLVNEGNTPHIGQARIWVDLARRLASDGFRVLRFDLSGNGDSDPRPGRPGHVARPPEAVDDIYEAMRAISPDRPTDTVLIGFCSGAYLAFEQALVNLPRGICAINPIFSFIPPEEPGTADRPARQVTRGWFVRLARVPLRWLGRRQGGTELERWTKSLEAATWPVAVATRAPAVPQLVWRAVNRTLLENIPSDTIDHLVEQDVDTLIITGPGDFLPISLGAQDTIDRLRRSPRFHLEMISDLIHSSWEVKQRRQLIACIEEHLLGTYDPTEPASSS